jgi:hypothetical protein
MNFFARQRAAGRGQKLRLSESKVRLIRKRIAEGIPQRTIAKEFGIAPSTVSAVKSGQNWGHIKDEEAQ